MYTKQQSYLAEMGIEQWQLCHPDRMQGLTVERDDISDQTRLLIVTPTAFSNEDLNFLEKVTSSFDVSLKELRVVQPSQLFRLGDHKLEWVWFIDCSPEPIDSVKQLSSEKLAKVSAEASLKKALWNQIRSQKEL